MRIAPAATVAFLASNNVAWRGDLITLTLVDGTTVYRWTTAEVSLVVSGNTYLTGGSTAPLVRRAPLRQSSRLSVDTLDVYLFPGTFKIGGKSLAQLAQQGYFFGARLQLDHLVGPDPVTAIANGAIPKIFEGRVATVQPQGGKITLRVKSELDALNTLLPKFPLRPQCGNVVYDPHCGLSKAAFTLVGSASGVPTTTTVPTTTAGIIAKAAAYFNLGIIQFVSGANVGQRRAVSGWASNTFTLALPLPFAPVAGDNFNVYPGCDRSKTMCLAKFNNLARYRGFPHIPTPESGG